ncbi:hypothetical protein ACXYMO_05560 [Arenibacterium sp. CAU 1754]
MPLFKTGEELFIWDIFIDELTGSFSRVSTGARLMAALIVVAVFAVIKQIKAHISQRE